MLAPSQVLTTVEARLPDGGRQSQGADEACKAGAAPSGSFMLPIPGYGCQTTTVASLHLQPILRPTPPHPRPPLVCGVMEDFCISFE